MHVQFEVVEVKFPSTKYSICFIFNQNILMDI